MQVSEFIVYGIKNPATQQFIYVGKSSQWLIRPRQHLKRPAANSLLRQEIINIRNCGLEPLIEVIENIEDRGLLSEREKFWIQEYIQLGHPLCNQLLSGRHPACGPRMHEGRTKLARFIKTIRMEMGMDQFSFAKSIGIGVKALRSMEQGNYNTSLHSFIKILDKAGYDFDVMKKAP